MREVALLVLRLTTGGLLAGHGAQKLFGAFEGPGLEGTAGMMESLALRPGHVWAVPAALAEFGGGTLTALGLGGALGPIAIMSSMAMAATTAHWGKPIWVTKGGAELPVTNTAVALALAIAGPGRYSLDRALGLRVPATLVALAAAGAAASIAVGLVRRRRELERREEERAALGGTATA